MNISSYHVDTHREETLKDQPSTKRDAAERFAGRHRSRKIPGLLLWFVTLVGRGGVAVELQNFDWGRIFSQSSLFMSKSLLFAGTRTPNILGPFQRNNN